MDGIILINKPKNYTSRDIVNIISKKLHTKKVGHTGTLDPIATGILVICVGKYTKLVDLITSYDKEYIASVILGIETDTLDITGKVVRKDDASKITIDQIKEVLNSFIGKYQQEVPIYSAVKINGKKLYEYARNNEKITLPKREVEIKNIELLGDIKYIKDKIYFDFKVSVSKGTYIRSLIRDIGLKLNVSATMENLKRTKQGKFSINKCSNIDDEYDFLNIKDVLDYPIVEIKDEILKKQVLNGAIIENKYDNDIIMFEYNNEIIALYKIYEKDNNKMKPYKMLIN